jgi:electron transfer flavoprotein beta subunit
MRIAVCVKQAVDEGELRLDSEGSPVLSGAATKMSTFDKNGVEEAVRKKSEAGGEVVVFTAGPQDAKRTMKEALAMGADRGVHVVVGSEDQDALLTSYLLSRAIKASGHFDLVITSEGSSDTYTGLVGPMLAEWLSLPFIGYVRKIELRGPAVTAERALEDTVEVVEAALPVVVSVVSEINEPRYPTLIQIMQAGKKQIEELRAESLLDGAPKVGSKVLGMKAQSVARKKVIFEGDPQDVARKLVESLRAEGVLKR